MAKTKRLNRSYPCYALRADDGDGNSGFLVSSSIRFTLGATDGPLEFQSPLLFPTEREAQAAMKKHQKKIKDRLSVVPVVAGIRTASHARLDAKGES